MIVQMKKVAIVTPSPKAADTLLALRELGVLHIDYIRRPESEDIERIRAEKELVEKAWRFLSSRKAKKDEKKDVPAIEIAKQALFLSGEINELHGRLQFVEKEIERLAPLGDFSPEDVSRLRQNEIFVKIYRCKKSALDRSEVDVSFEIVSSKGSLVTILAVNDQDFHLPWDEVPIPEKGLAQFEREKAEIHDKLRRIEVQTDECAAGTLMLKRALASLDERLRFAEVLSSVGIEKGLSYVRGYCPEDEIDRLRETCQRMGWGIMIAEPCEADDVPTLIRNPQWIRIIEPVFEFMGTVPGYREFDVSFWFLISLGLFFAMLVGDGGYGLLFLAGTFFLHRKFKGVPGSPFALLYVFSGATLLWGFITGTWFGVEELARLPFLSRFIIPALYSYSDNQAFMIQLCFVIGAVHMTIAHGIRMIRYLKSLRALADLGWILILWSLYFVAGHFVLDKSIPSLVFYFLPFGMFLTAAFTNPQAHFIRSFFLSLGDLPLNVIRSFSDVVSYLRLFAVGYATLVLALSFNQMAADVGWDNVPRAVGALLILLVGHSLNIILGGMAVLVHGIRLNMLEFSTHLEMTWSGRKFSPFRRETQDQAG